MSPFLIILRSILLTCVVSTIIATLYMAYFWQVFAITTAAQIIIFYIVNTIRDVSLQKIENARIAEFSKQGLMLKCPCYKQNSEFIPITLNEENMYNCGECNKPIKVDIEATTLLATIPVDLDTPQVELSKIYNKLASKNG